MTKNRYFSGMQSAVLNKIFVVCCLLLAIFLLQIPASHAQEYGFKDIPFGTSRVNALQKLKQKKLRIVKTSNYIFLPGYSFGNRKVKITLSFDKKDRFFEYSITLPESGYKPIDSIGEDLKYLTEVFDAKFGNKRQTFKVTTSPDAKSEGKEDVIYKIIHLWTLDKVTAQIGFYFSYSQGRSNFVATVEDNALIKEREKQEEKDAAKNIERAKQSF